jgi:DNA-binding transcriptional MerR regulator
MAREPEEQGTGDEGGAPQNPRPKERLQTIGQVVRLLQHEFPDLSISKVRYLEDRGLLMPQRTPGGYRKFSRSEVRRLRTILTLQRDEFLPLEVIRDRLQRGTDSVVGRALAPMAPVEASQALRREQKRYTWDEAVETAGVSEEFLRQLGEFSLVEKGAGSAVGPVLTDTDIEVARICDLLARHGVEPRNLRLLRSSAEREASMLEQIVSPSLRSQHLDRREMGEKTLQDLGTLLSRLLDLLLYKELRRLVVD